jgi:hypothetical protein
MLEPSETKLQKLLNIYESSPLIHALIQVAISPLPYGIGSALDSALTARIVEMRDARMRAFYDELAMNPELLTKEVIQHDDFLHAHFATLKAAVNSKRAEKCALFARLLKGGLEQNALGSDAFEEYLNILDDMSMREIAIVNLMRQQEKAFEQAFNDPQRPDSGINQPNPEQFWAKFEEAVANQHGLDGERLMAALTRITRTGLIEEKRGSLAYLEGKVRWQTTTTFRDLALWILHER